MLKSWCRIFRGSHLIRGYSTVLAVILHCFLRPVIEAVV